MSGKLKQVHLRSFGSVTGLLFESGGSAEVILDALEVKRIIEAWAEHEAAKKKPDERIVSALKLLAPKTRNINFRLVAEVPIAQRKATITPVFD